MNIKAAKFFCENCGAEVPQNAKVCRHCGRFFSSVRCPKCGLTGRPDTFTNGCPECGYAFSLSEKNTNKESGRLNKILPEKRSSAVSRKRLLKIIKMRQNDYDIKSSLTGDDTLPFWIYFFTVFILAIIILIFTVNIL